MGEREALLSAILNSPSDDTARLVFSDWLEENGEVEFGRFLRAGVVAASYRGGRALDKGFHDVLTVLGEVAVGGGPARWVAALGLGTAPVVRGDWRCFTACDEVWVQQGTVDGIYLRGLLTGLRVELRDWCRVSRVALERWPLEWVVVKDVPGVRLTIRAPKEGGVGRWSLGAEWTDPDRSSRERWQTFTAQAIEYPTRAALIEDVPVAVPELIADVRRQSIDG